MLRPLTAFFVILTIIWELFRTWPADWTCQLNHYTFPFDTSLKRSFMRQSNNLPFQQHLAHDTLYRTGSSIRNTDLSFLFHGDVALHHLNRSLSSHLALHPQAITNLANAGLTHLNDIAFFSSDSDNHTTLRLQPHSNVSFQNATTRAQERWPQISLWIRNITLKDLVDGFMAMGDINNCVGTRWTDVENRTCVQSADTHNNLRRAAAGEYSVPLWFLVLPPLLRMQNAHNLINAYHAVSIHPPLPSYIPPGLFDSDASIILPVSAFRTPRSVTFSSISRQSALALNLISSKLLLESTMAKHMD